MTAAHAIVSLLRDRQDASEIRRIATRLVGLRALSERGQASAWSEIVAGGSSAIEAERQRLERATPGLWPRPLPDLPRDRLDALLAAVGELPLQGQDALGQVFTQLIGQLARSEGRRGGQYFTPPSLVELLLAVVPVHGARVYDPCCGSGGLLVAAGSTAESLHGQELNPETWRLARWNAQVHGLPLDAGTRAADTLREDLHAGETFDAILANPPFNLSHWGDEELWEDPRFALRPPLRQANFAWLLHILAHLDPKGRAAIVLPNGTLYGKSAAERRIRRALIESGRIEAILALPPELFHNTAIAACVWVLGPTAEGVHLLDLREHGHRTARTQQVLTPQVFARVQAALDAARRGEELDETGFARSVSSTLLDGDLRPGHWIRPEVSAHTVSDARLAEAIQAVRTLTHEAAQADIALLAALDALESPESSS